MDLLKPTHRSIHQVRRTISQARTLIKPTQSIRQYTTTPITQADSPRPRPLIPTNDSPNPSQTSADVQNDLTSMISNMLGEVRAKQDQERDRSSPRSRPPPRKTVISSIPTSSAESTYGPGGTVAKSLSPQRQNDYSALYSDLLNAPPRFAADGSLMGRSARNQIQLRLKPTLGRTVEVDDTKNFNLTRAFLTLETRINKGGNSVKADSIAQKYHTRRGQAVKILRRERWRALFKEGFKAEVATVRRMMRQGW